MERINIRIAKKTHRRLNLIKGQMGISYLAENTPTLDDVINAGLDLLEQRQGRVIATQGAAGREPVIS